MTGALPRSVRRLLREGVLCYLASSHPAGPHVTPVVYAVHGSNVWVTTARRSVKARTWRRDDRVGGLVRAGDRAVAFAGHVSPHDLLDPASWPRSVLHAPSLTRAATAFTTRNARFFAGYALDAYRVPLAWMPPGRVFAAVSLEQLALIGPDEVDVPSGRFGGRVKSEATFRAARSGDALRGIPDAVRERIAGVGDAALGLQGSGPPVVLPARWQEEGAFVSAVVEGRVLSLGRGGPEVKASLTIDHASQWRARAMTGVLVQGDGTIYRIPKLRSGARSAARIAEKAGVDPDRAAIVRIRPRRLVWWRGWDSGTVRS
ncbi:MAG: pyridoxamine 5'-phosphate oxidase family protein [Actinomycetota bacterium]